MKILLSERIEDCFDGSQVIAYTFDVAWDREHILSLKSLGKLEYFPEFPKPFFRLLGMGGLQVKGVEGDRTCRAIFPKKDREVIKEQFETFFSASGE